jgi:glycolate oxidase FAD binding subunit
MAETGLSIARRLGSLLGDGGTIGTDSGGLPRVAPHSDDAVALVLGTATSEGWRVRIEGSAGWMPPDAVADLALTTAQLTEIPHLDASDLVATVQAGVMWSDLRRALADHGAWAAIDPPGSGRSIGSVVATGTAGPLRGGFGNVRDHLLGVTLVTGDGRVIRPGGRVVKNVAGFDLTKLAAGSFGAFGVLTSVTLRLRAVPRADLTLIGSGQRDALLTAALAILHTGNTPAALEVLSPLAATAGDWTLAVRLLGTRPEVEAARDAVSGAVSLTLHELPAQEAARLWPKAGAGATQGGSTLRLGALPTSLDTALALVEHHLPEGWLSAGVGAGIVRWSGDAAADRLKLLRRSAAQQEMPLTLERAPWEVRSQVGHFGAYRDGVGRLVAGLRHTFDPAGVLVVPVGDA